MIARTLVTVAFAISATFASANAEPALQSELEQLYQRHITLVAEDKIDEALELRTEELQAEVRADLGKGTEAEQAQMLNMLKGMTPDKFVAEHAQMDGEQAATLYGVGSKVVPVGPEAGELKRVEMMIEFARADGDWRIGLSRFLGDPDAVKRIDDVAYEPIENYDQSKDVNMGGRIVRVALEADHTLVVVRMLDEEQALYLPDQTFLKDRGFEVDLLQPYAMVEAGGHPHLTNPQKVWATSLNVR